MSTSNGSFTGVGNANSSQTGGFYGSTAADDNASSYDNATGSSTGSDSGTSSMTVYNGECWSLSEQGSFANDSYAFSAYVSSSSDSNSVNAQQTDSISETVVSSGHFSGGSGECNSASVTGTWTSTGCFPSSGSFSLGLENDASDSDSGYVTETTTATDTTTATEEDTFSETRYESGMFGAGSFALASVLYNQSSTANGTTQATDTYVSSETMQDNGSTGGGQDGYNSDGYRVYSSDSATSQETISGGDTRTEYSLASGSVYQAGSFGNDSYALSSYALTQQGGDTVTESSSDTFTSLSSGSTSGQETIDGWQMYNGSGTFARTGSGGDSAGGTQTDGWNLSEFGTMAAGSLALSSYVFSEQENSSDSSSDSSGWTETLSGSNGADTYSGTDSGVESDTRSDSSSAALLEQGTAAGDILTLSVVSYSGSGSETGSALDSESSVWSGASYSGNDTDNAQSGDNGNYSVTALGCYSNDSMSLSSYMLQLYFP